MSTDNHPTMAAALTDAMNDLIEGGKFRRIDPAICRDRQGYCYYGSIHHGDDVAYDLAGLHDSGYCPTSSKDISECANALAHMIAEEAMDEDEG
jgi:hypothetical protein